MPLLCAIAIVRPEMKVIRGDSSVLLPGSSLQSAQASKNYNLILFRTILHPPDSFVSKNEGMAEGPTGKVAVSGLLQALRLLEVLWIMSAMQSLSCVPRFLSLNALAIRTRAIEV